MDEQAANFIVLMYLFMHSKFYGNKNKVVLKVMTVYQSPQFVWPAKAFELLIERLEAPF